VGGKIFWKVLAWRKLVFRLVELVNQSKEKDCEDLCTSPMICIGGLIVVWFSYGDYLLRASALKVCAE
jgi:hypothetical protein